jgi:hypothetical protein
MTTELDFLLNRSNAALIIFTASAAAASVYTKSPVWRAAAGIAGVLISLCIAISARSLFEWAVSAVERPSIPGFVLLAVLAIATTTGRHIDTPEFRFDAMVLALGGFILYPASAGFIDYDTYVLGYSGYLLPAAIAAVLAYAVYRGYLLTALALNAAIIGFLAGAGQSLNLWDHVIDPLAWIIGTGAWIAIAIRFLVFSTARKLAQT